MHTCITPEGTGARTAVLPAGVGTENQYTRQVDIFAFGLATLELATKHKVRSERNAQAPAEDSLQPCKSPKQLLFLRAGHPVAFTQCQAETSKWPIHW